MSYDNYYRTEDILAPGRSYCFRIRAKNDCGYSVWCDKECYTCPHGKAAEPDDSTPVMCRNDACAVVLSWNPPASAFGNSNTTYKVKVATKTQSYEIVECEGNDRWKNRMTECRLSVKTLSMAPFSLPVGQYVYSSVQSCDGNDCGKWSEPQSGTCVMANSCPTLMNPPIWSNEGTNSNAIQLDWDNVMNTNGQSRTAVYEVLWDEGSGNFPTKVLIRTSRPQHSFTPRTNSKRGAFRFAIRPLSTCETCQPSQAITVS